MSALEDRRQNAREAFYDAQAREGAEWSESGMEEAIETATRVRITDEIINAFSVQAGNYERGLRAAFETAGFEVVE